MTDIYGERKMLPLRLAELLVQCSRFSTIPEHARKVAYGSSYGLLARTLHRLPISFSRKIETALHQAADDGLLASEMDFTSGLRDSMVPVHTNRIDGITSCAIISCDRPEFLTRCIAALGRDLETYGVKCLILCDDSRSETKRKLVMEIAQKNRNLCEQVRLIDKDRRLKLAASLSAETGIRQDLVEFGILGKTPVEAFSNTTGATRNTVLLQTVGSKLFSCDEDIVGGIEGGDDGTIRVAGIGTGVDVSVFGSEEDVLENAVNQQEESLLGVHGATLGGQLGSVCGDGEVQIGEIRSELFQRLMPDARIRYTMSGIIGDCVGGPLHISPSFLQSHIVD